MNVTFCEARVSKNKKVYLDINGGEFCVGLFPKRKFVFYNR